MLLFYDVLRRWVIGLHIVGRNCSLLQLRISSSLPLFFSIPASYLGNGELIFGFLLAKLYDGVIVFSLLLFLRVVLLLSLSIKGVILPLFIEQVVVELLLDDFILFKQLPLLFVFLQSFYDLEG